MARCQGITSNNHRCRKRLINKQNELNELNELNETNKTLKIFCVNHRPKNIDDLIENCPVCCSEIEESKDNIQVLKCGHAHHRQCLKMWFDSGKDTCPMCRYKVVKKQPKNYAQTHTYYQYITYTLNPNSVTNEFYNMY